MTSRHRRTPERSGARGSSDFRRERLERLLFEELRCVVRDDIRDPALEGVLLLRLDLAPDASHARVAYAARAAPGEQEGLVARRTGAALAAASGFLRARLAGALDLERLPRLGFTFVGLAARDEGQGAGPCLD